MKQGYNKTDRKHVHCGGNLVLPNTDILL